MDRVLTGMWRRRAAALLCLGGLAAGWATAQAAAQTAQRPPDAELGPVVLRFGMYAFAAGWAMDGIWAGLAPVYGGGTGFQDNGRWGDAYLRPGVTAQAALPIGMLSGGVSASWGGTLGTDLYNASDSGRAMLEDA